MMEVLKSQENLEPHAGIKKYLKSLKLSLLETTENALAAIVISHPDSRSSTQKKVTQVVTQAQDKGHPDSKI